MHKLAWTGNVGGGSLQRRDDFAVVYAARDRRVFDQLCLAERENDLGQAARLASSLGGRALRDGRYAVALHWAEWSLHLLRASDRATMAMVWPVLQLRFTLRLLLGDVSEENLIPPWVTTRDQEGHWLTQFLNIHLLLARHEGQAALELADHCWTQVNRRDWLIFFVNPYVRLLVAAGEGDKSRQVAQHMLALSTGLPPTHRFHGLLNCGLALSEEQPAEAATYLARARPGLSAPWNLQAALFSSHVLSMDGHTDDAQLALRGMHPLLTELAPAGLAALGRPAGIGAETRLALRPPPCLHLQFLGRMSASWGGESLGLRLRFAELLVALCLHPDGLTNEQLALAVYGDGRDPACCKTELSRLKRLLPLLSRPYRLGTPVQADFLEIPRLLRTGQVREALELYHGPLLPASDAPEVRALRDELEEELRSAVLDHGTFEALWILGSRLHHDLMVWEALVARMPSGDPRRGMAVAHVHSLHRSWGA